MGGQTAKQVASLSGQERQEQQKRDLQHGIAHGQWTGLSKILDEYVDQSDYSEELKHKIAMHAIADWNSFIRSNRHHFPAQEKERAGAGGATGHPFRWSMFKLWYALYPGVAKAQFFVVRHFLDYLGTMM